MPTPTIASKALPLPQPRRPHHGISNQQRPQLRPRIYSVHIQALAATVPVPSGAGARIYSAYIHSVRKHGVRIQALVSTAPASLASSATETEPKERASVLSSASTSTDQGPTRAQISNNATKFIQESSSRHSPAERPVRPITQRPPPKLFVKF